jgi:putative transcription antitermination factor YqgF
MEIIASAYEVYKRKNTDEDVKHIVQIVEDLTVGEIVIGLPLKMDGSEGQSVEMAKAFGNHPGIIGWQIDNEVHPYDHGCYCDF